MKIILLCLGLLTASLTPDPPGTGTLQLTVENITEAEGHLEIVLYNSADSYQKQGRAVRLSVSATGALSVPLEEVPFGEVSILIYHDVDGDGKFDQNRLGIPQEPYGFSNNIRPRFRGPTYEETKFTFGRDGQAHQIKIGGIWD